MLPVRSDNSEDIEHSPITLLEKEIQAEYLRVCLFSESFAPVQNGVTTSLNTLISGLRLAGHRVWVCAPSHASQDSAETNVLRFPSFVSAYNREYPLAFPFYPRLALSTRFNRLRLDIVHTHTPFVLGLTGAKLAISRGTPLVSTFHTLYSKYTHYMPVLPDAMSHGLLEVYLPWYYNRCTHVICPSQMARKALIAMGVETPIQIVPTGIPIPNEQEVCSAKRDSARNAYGWKSHQKVLLYAGRLEPEKNVNWLIEIVSKVRTIDPNVILAIAGQGSDRENLQMMSEGVTGGPPNPAVQFLGVVAHDEMNDLYGAADLFCFASASETQGLVIGEARATGLPALVVNSGGAPETVANGVDGYTIEPGDTDYFVSTILRLMRNPQELSNLSAGARQRAQEFTPAKMIEKVVEVYELAKRADPNLHNGATPLDVNGKGSYWNIFSPR